MCRPLQPLHVDRASKRPRPGSPVKGADGLLYVTHNPVTTHAIRTRQGKSRSSESSPRYRNALRIRRQRLVVAGCRRRFAGNLCTGGGQRRFDGLRLASADDDDSKLLFGLIHAISAAIGVGVLSCLACFAMIFVRRKKHHKTISAVEDEESARRLQAEKLAYEQKCAQMNTGNSAAAAAVTTDTKNFSRPRAGIQRALRRRHKRPR